MSEGSAITAQSRPRPGPARRVPQRYGTIVVIGGGCYGSYYVRQLGRAVGAEALVCSRVVVVDRDPNCRVGVALRENVGPSAEAPPVGAPPQHSDRAAITAGLDPFRAARIPVTLAVADWAEFMSGFLEARCGEARAADAIVPSPLMPHLLYDWLVERARRRWPGRSVGTVPLPRPPATPWERAAGDTHYVSFAEWVCPINCIEPPVCPEIRGPRTWSMPPAVRAYVAAEQARGSAIDGPVLFHCTHRAWGVGMIDVPDVLAGDAFVTEAGARGPTRVLVGTVSHCHGALGLLELGA